MVQTQELALRKTALAQGPEVLLLSDPQTSQEEQLTENQPARLKPNKDDLNYYTGPRMRIEDFEAGNGGWVLALGLVVGLVIMVALQLFSG